MLDLTTLTPTQRRLWEILKDGEPHTKDELWKCIGDETSVSSNLANHISMLREKLKRHGLQVAYVTTRGMGKRYQMFRRLVNPNDGVV